MIHPSNTFVAQLFFRWRYALLALAFSVALAAAFARKELDFDRNVANLIADRSGIVEPFLQLKRTFGGNEIVLAVYEDANLLANDHSGIDRLQAIRTDLEKIAGVRSALSLDKLSTPLIPISSQANPYAVRMRELFEGYTHNQAGDISVVVCMLEPEEEAKQSRQETIAALRKTMQNLPAGLAPGMLTGEPVMLVDGFRFVEQDGRRLGIWSTVLLGLTLLLCFRSIRWMLICIAVVQLSLLLTRLIMLSLGLRMSMVSSMLTAVVTVVAVATIVHLIVRYNQAQREGRSLRDCFAQTTSILFIPVAWACLTDAVGFTALKSSSVGPVGDFGIMMGISCLAVLVSVWLLVPALTTIPFSFDNLLLPSSVGEKSKLQAWLQSLADLVQRKSRLLAALSLGLILFALSGLQFLRVETDFTKNFRGNTDIVRAYQFVEERLGGVGVGDMLVPAPQTLTWEYLRHVRQFEERIMEQTRDGGPLQGLSKVLSLADAVLVGAPKLSIDKKANFKSNTLARVSLSAMKSKIPAFYDALHAEDPDAPGNYYLRIMFRAREQQDAESKRRIIDTVQQLGDEYFQNKWGNEDQAFSVTGFYVLLTSLIDSIVADQYSTFLFAVAGIGLTMLVAFRSIRLALIALVPNALPVLMVSGFMGWLTWSGWFDFKINMGSAMIAAVSLGLSIDSSIHYIFAFQFARKQGHSIAKSIQEAHGTVGLSMIFATLALIVGFSVLATSNFTPTVYFGTLVSLAMLGGLLGNLVVLPLLLKLFLRDDLPQPTGTQIQEQEALST